MRTKQYICLMLAVAMLTWTAHTAPKNGKGKNNTPKSTLTFDDYSDVRVFHLLLTIFYYEGNFEESFEFARQQGLKPFDVIVRLQNRLAHAPEAFRQVIDELATRGIVPTFTQALASAGVALGLADRCTFEVADAQSYDGCHERQPNNQPFLGF